MANARLLLVGIDPDLVDFTKSAVPDLAAAKVRVAVEANRAQLETLGYNDGERAQMSQIGLPVAEASWQAGFQIVRRDRR